MTDEQALRAEVLENPDDDTPRLVYADYLEDHPGSLVSEEGDRLRAEFIRKSVWVAQNCEIVPKDNPEKYAELVKVRNEVSRMLAYNFQLKQRPVSFKPDCDGLQLSPSLVETNETSLPHLGGWSIGVARGFVEELTVEVGGHNNWHQRMEKVLLNSPVHRVLFMTYDDPEEGHHAYPLGLLTLLPRQGRKYRWWDATLFRVRDRFGYDPYTDADEMGMYSEKSREEAVLGLAMWVDRRLEVLHPR